MLPNNKYIFSQALKDVYIDFVQLHKKDISTISKINIMRHFMEWIIIDFLYRTAILDDYDDYEDLVKKVHNKQIPKLLDKIEKKNVINNQIKTNLENIWRNILIKNYHHKFNFSKNTIQNDFKKTWNLIDKFLEDLNFFWYGQEIQFTKVFLQENAEPKRAHIFNKENGKMLCSHKCGNKPSDWEKSNPTTLSIHKFIQNNVLSCEQKYVEITQYNDYKNCNFEAKVCSDCLRRIFGMHSDADNIDFHNLLIYIKSILENE